MATADLEPYIHTAILKTTRQKSKPIFTVSKAFPAPKLRKGVKNTILIFPGSFNPPHMGHKLLLTHAFFRSDLENIVAPFIVPNPDKAIRDKYRSEEHALILSFEERTKLWGEKLLTPWSWVMPYTSKERSTSEGELLYQVRLDGYRLEFALVLGADLIDFGAERLKADLNDKVEPTVISCDGLRPVERDESGAPKYLMTGYSNWKVCTAANKRLLKTLRKGEHSTFAVLQLLYPQKAKVVGKKVSTRGKEERARSALKESLRMSGEAWTCFWLKAPHLQFHFLPLPIDAVGGAGSELSATCIRRIIRDNRKSSASKMGTVLADVSLSPRLLADMVKERQEEKARKKETRWRGQNDVAAKKQWNVSPNKYKKYDAPATAR